VDLSDENITELTIPEQMTNQPEEQSKKEEIDKNTTIEMTNNTITTNTVRIS
jgi:hypothetical protein